jgi:Arc/MetJ-type ribon-helix-helix transcriptional regulator
MGKVQINVQVDEKQKSDWEGFVEESGRYSSLSGLIRSAVEKEINGDDAQPSMESPALSSDVQDLKDDVARIRKDVRWLREHEQDEVDISELAQQVFDELEELPLPSTPVEVPENADMDEQEFRRKQAASMVVTPEDENSSRNPQTVNAIAERVEPRQDRVKDAIDHLQDQFLPVVGVTVDGETHYFREE